MAILPRKEKIIEEIEDFLVLDDLIGDPRAQRFFERMKSRSRITGGGLSKYRKHLLEFQEKVAEYNFVLEEIDRFGIPSTLKNKENEWRLISPLNRISFYRQNCLPDEINLLIEEAVIYSLNITSVLNYHGRFPIVCIRVKQAKEKREKEIQEALNIEMLGIQKLKEKAKQQKEIEEILAKEIKEYHTNWEQYLDIKPLPALFKKQNKIKTLGNKLKTEFKQVFKSKEYSKPVNSNGSNFLTLLMTTGLIFKK